MQILYGYRDLQTKIKNPIVAIGIFDGLHLGHKRVISRILNFKTADSDKVVMTFDPHPKTIISPNKKLPRIMSLEHRLVILEKMGVDAVIVIKFTDFIAGMSPEDFVKRILLHIGTKKVYVGANFHFGHGKCGNVETFKRIGREYDIDVRTVQPIKMRGRVVSSTWLRKLITNGEIKKAEKLLRRPVSVLGTVVAGDKRGQTLGVPTANIDSHQEVIPPPGVYAVRIDIDGKLFDGVLNIGFKPTFYGRKLKKRKEPKIEVHILNFNGNLYDKHLEIFFISKLRREKKFKNADKFKKQIIRDVEKTKKILSEKKEINRIMRYKTVLG